MNHPHIPHAVTPLPPDQTPESTARAFYERIRTRRSVRFFSDRPVSEETIRCCVAAAGTASLAGDGVLVTVRVRGVSGGTTAASWLAFTFNEGNPEASATGTVLTVGNPTGMEDAPEAVELRAWPNPSRGRVTVDVPCGGASVGVDVVDVLGRVVARVPSVCGTVALPALMAGRYIVRAGRWTAPVTVAK